MNAEERLAAAKRGEWVKTGTDTWGCPSFKLDGWRAEWCGPTDNNIRFLVTAPGGPTTTNEELALGKELIATRQRT